MRPVQVASGTLSSSSLDRYTCIALAGVAAEYVHFGQAEGGLNDVQQLDGLLKALQVCLTPVLDQSSQQAFCSGSRIGK